MNKIQQIENKISQLLDNKDEWKVEGKQSLRHLPTGTLLGFCANGVWVYRNIDTVDLSPDLIPKIKGTYILNSLSVK